mgnify:CR=1 FL=1
MSVKIRLKQIGKRNARMFRIVAVDESKKRDGAVIEELGVSLTHGSSLNVKKDRIDYWKKTGARLSLAVQKLLSSP